MIGAFQSGYCFHVPWLPQAFAGFFVRRWFRCFFYCRHPRSRYFGSVVPVYVVWAESCVNCLFHFPCVPMAFSVNMLKKNKTIDSMNQIA